MGDDTDHEDRFKIGARVKCMKHGTLKGKKGKIRDILNDREFLKVEFEHTTLIDKRTYFEPLGRGRSR